MRLIPWTLQSGSEQFYTETSLKTDPNSAFFIGYTDYYNYCIEHGKSGKESEAWKARSCQVHGLVSSVSSLIDKKSGDYSTVQYFSIICFLGYTVLLQK